MLKMAPTSIGLNNSNGNVQNSESPLSKTYQYRKIMKPMLERKRRARINRCLDELKDLITGALQNTDGEENITKLEKADILELTCRHFKNLQRQNKFYIKTEQSYADQFRDGFSQCTKEVTNFLYSQQNRAGEHIIVHLNECMRRFDNITNNVNDATQNNSNNNNNNNYIKNENLRLDINHVEKQQQSYNLPSHRIHHHQQNVHQPIPLVGKSLNAMQIYLPLSMKHTGRNEERTVDSSSPISHDDCMLSPRSFTSSPGEQLKDEGPWRPW